MSDVKLLPKIDLSEDETKLIQRIRLSPPYATIKVEKRPTATNQRGEVSRITIEESFLVRDITIIAGL